MDLNNLRYQHIERALMRHYDVKLDSQKAFKARIRHLRNLGVPNVEKVGKGTQLTYTRRHLWELFLALELTRLGISPATAALAVEAMGKHFDKLMVELDCQLKERLLLVFRIEEFGPKPADVMQVSMEVLTARKYADEILSEEMPASHVALEFSRRVKSIEWWLTH